MMKKTIKIVTEGVTLIFVGGMVTGFIGCVALLAYAAGDSHLLDQVKITKERGENQIKITRETEEQNESEEDSVETEE